jgi:8-oxo-dGTP pyrophosphatase MutT (NUDIX family)
VTGSAAALAGRLAALHPADAAEAAHREAVVALLRTAERPFARDQFDPGHVTGSAFIVAPERQSVLLVFHAALRRWLQPGGHMDPGETDPSVTAAREALEETGLAAAITAAPFDVDVHPIPARDAAPAHRHFDVRYLGVVQGMPAPVASGVVEARWFTRAEAARLDLDAGVRRMMAKAAARGLL